MHRVERRLHVEALVVDLVDRQRPVGVEVVEPAVVELGLEEEAVVLYAGVDREDPVVDLLAR